MPRWLIELVGEPADTEEVPRWFPDGDICAVEKDGKHYLTGARFESFDDGGVVRAEAAEAFKPMSAVISLLWNAFNPPQVGAIYREHDDGRCDVWLSLESNTCRTKVNAFIVDAGAQGAQPRHTQAQELHVAAQASLHLQEALRVWSDKYRSWGRLHRVLEEIEAHLGQLVSVAGFCTGKERERFTRSANCAEVAGMDARHGSGKFKPPKRPMTLPEAEDFVRVMLERTLRETARTLP